VYAEKDSSSIGDFVEDSAYKSPDVLAVESALREDVDAALRTLTAKEAEIIRFRFGLGGGAPMSLKEIGDKFNLTKERIRQIEKKALKRLQHPSRSRFLESYVA